MLKDIIKKAKNGTYYYRANLGKHPKTGKQIQKYRSGFRTKTEARDDYTELLATFDINAEDGKEDVSRMSFSDFTEEIFLPWYKTKVRKRTYDNRIKAIAKHFSYFDKYDVDEILPMHVQKWQLSLSRKYKSSYARSLQGIFSIAMDRAVILGLTKENPSRVVGNIKKTREVEVDFWTKEEFEKFIACFDRDDYYHNLIFVIVWLLFMTGMRIGEATALYWDDVDFETGAIKIRHSLYYKSSNEFYRTKPKTKASIRTVVIDSDTLEHLRAWKERQSKVAKSNFILSYNSLPFPRSTLSHLIDKFSKRAGIHRIRVHALRHSHASMLIGMGVNALLIKDRLGHEDIETTLGTYGHLYPNTNFEIANQLNGLVQINEEIEPVKVLTKNQFTSEEAVQNTI